jgi:hypothetical protein
MAEIRHNNNKPEFVEGLVSDTEITIKELSSAPSNESGKAKVYTKSDGNIYFKNSSGTESNLIAGASAGATAPDYHFDSGMPQYVDDARISIEYSTIKDKTNSVIMTVSSPTTVSFDDVPHEWLFDEGTGTTVADTKGVAPLSFIGSPTWGSGYLNTGSSSNGWTTPAGSFYDCNNFSLGMWVEWNSLAGSSVYIVNMSDSSGTAESNYNWGIYTTSNGASINANFSSTGGTPVTLTPAGFTPQTGIKYFIMLTYQYNSNGTSNHRFRITSDGVTWHEASTNAQTVPVFSSTKRLRSMLGTTFGQNVKYYRMYFYRNRVIDDSEMQALYNAGSEASAMTSTYGNVNSVAISSNLSGTISTSGTTVTGTGTSFLSDFRVGDVIYSMGQGRKINAIASNTSMTMNAAFMFDISGKSYQRGGLGYGAMYYLYAISNGTNSGYILSTRNDYAGEPLIDFPSGYTYYRQFPIAFKIKNIASTPSRLLIPFKVTTGWPQKPTIMYTCPFDSTASIVRILTAGTATSRAIVDCSDLVPAISTQVWFSGAVTGTAGVVVNTTLRPLNDTTKESSFGPRISGTGTTFFAPIPAQTDDNQRIEYNISAQTIYLNVAGYTVSEDLL